MTLSPFEWLTSSQSVLPLIESLDLHEKEKKALHIGCGSSTLGEFLVDALGFDFVLNIDKDPETLERMRQRWEDKYVDESSSRRRQCLQYQVVDFRDAPEQLLGSPYPLILEKSTLDCTLCSTDATAGLLALVYRHLAPGGFYLVISFNSLDLMRPLLQDLPGANWIVTHQEMTRHVEQLIETTAASTTTDTTTTPLSSSCWSGASHVPDTAMSTRTLNVLVCHKLPTDSDNSHNHELDLEAVQRHVVETSNTWFRILNPMLSDDRRRLVEEAFGTENSKSLSESYQLIFTAAERENLTYEHFLEDWDAYVMEHPNISTTHMSLTIAFDFLHEMQ
jgi:SAM-dependent methyltransferase